MVVNRGRTADDVDAVDPVDAVDAVDGIGVLAIVSLQVHAVQLGVNQYTVTYWQGSNVK